MSQRFKPDRQGATHVLESSDIAIIRGTPIYAMDGSLHDNRIRISSNGFAERALWIDYPDTTLGSLRSEFHRWTSQLTREELDGILAALGKLLPAVQLDVSRYSNDSILTIRHWDRGSERCAIILNGNDQYSERMIPIEDEIRFRTAWNAIQDSIPGNVSCRIDE